MHKSCTFLIIDFKRIFRSAFIHSTNPALLFFFFFDNSLCLDASYNMEEKLHFIATLNSHITCLSWYFFHKLFIQLFFFHLTALLSLISILYCGHVSSHTVRKEIPKKKKDASIIVLSWHHSPPIRIWILRCLEILTPRKPQLTLHYFCYSVNYLKCSINATSEWVIQVFFCIQKTQNNTSTIVLGYFEHTLYLFTVFPGFVSFSLP